MALDIGSLVFRDILLMTEYPGAPFTGNIISDLVMFLFIPTVFIIIVIYTLVGRITPHHKLGLLLSVAFYLFIVFGGYYRMFALLAGPYFLFLLIFVGILFFFAGHFGLTRQSGGGSRGGPFTATATETDYGALLNEYERSARNLSLGNARLKELQEESKISPGTVDRALAVQQETVNDATKELSRIEGKLDEMKIGHKAKTELKKIRHRYGL